MATATAQSNQWDTSDGDSQVLLIMLSVKVLIGTLGRAIIEVYMDPSPRAAMGIMSALRSSLLRASFPAKLIPVLDFFFQKLRLDLLNQAKKGWERPSNAMWLRNSMPKSGCCPQQLHRIFSTNDSSTASLYYLSSLLDWQNQDHRRCTEASCNANDIPEGRYRPKHTNTCTNPTECEFLGPCLDELHSIMSNDGVPVIGFIPKSDGSFGLTFMAADYGTEYTAISHVWSDGCGNENNNTLPQCQLQRPKSQLEALRDSEARVHLPSILNRKRAA